MATYTFDTLIYFELSTITLPSGYTKLQYIESTGTQYIDTLLVPTPQSVFSARVKLSVACSIYGSRKLSSNSNGFALHSNPNQPLLFNYGDTRTNSSVNPQYNTFIDVKADKKYKITNARAVWHCKKNRRHNSYCFCGWKDCRIWERMPRVGF